LMITILTEVRLSVNDDFICVSFMDKNMEHFFMCLLAICTSSLENSSIHLTID
jgi:hypothetical protein